MKEEVLVYQGVEYAHEKVNASDRMSTCWEFNRHGSVFSQNVISLNHALGCQTDLEMLLFGV